MSSGFLLVETLPGREGHVQELLAKTPGVTHHNLLFPAFLAVKVDHPTVEALATQLKRLDGVVSTRLYRARSPNA